MKRVLAISGALVLAPYSACVPLQDLGLYGAGGRGGGSSEEPSGGGAAGTLGGAGGEGEKPPTCGNGITELGEACDEAGMALDCSDSCTTIECPSGCSCQVFEGSALALCSEPLAWTSARQFCATAGFDFTLPATASEEALLQAWGAEEGAPSLWLGGSDAVETGVWRDGQGDQFWSGGAFGEAVGGAYTNWAPGQPDNFQDAEHCAELRSTGSALWNDLVCALERPFFCAIRPRSKDSCGDGSLDVGEACDRGGSSADCDVDCTTPLCGDGIANSDAGEECDDGNESPDDACDASCKRTGLVAHYRMTERIGTRIWDVAEMVHHGALQGSATLGEDGSGMQFPTADSVVVVPLATAPVIQGEISLMAVIQPMLPFSPPEKLLEHLVTLAETGVGETFLRLTPASLEGGSWWVSGSGQAFTPHPATADPYHFATVYRAGRWYNYVDGVPMDTGLSDNGALGAVGPLYLGGYLGRNFSGKMRQARIYDRALSDEQVLRIANAALSQ